MQVTITARPVAMGFKKIRLLFDEGPQMVIGRGFTVRLVLEKQKSRVKWRWIYEGPYSPRAKLVKVLKP